MRLSQGVPKSFTYEPIAAGGADVLLEAHSSSVAITETHSNRPPSSVLLHTGYYQRLNLPAPGCWHLRLQAGTRTGYITLWVR
jgi:hypothetical protein